MLLSDQLQLISVTEQGRAGNGPSRYPAADASGELIVFHSEADDLVPGDTNGVSDVFLRDLALGQTTRLTDAEQASANPALDFSGETLLYDQGTPTGQRQVFGQALDDTSTSERLSLQTDTQGHPVDAHHPAISADGRFVAYLEQTASAEDGACRVHFYDRTTDVYHRQRCPEELATASELARPMFSPSGDAVLWMLPGQAQPVSTPNVIFSQEEGG